MTLRTTLSAAATSAAPSITLPSSGAQQVFSGDKVAIFLTQNNTNAITTSPSGADWTQRELDTTTSSSCPFLLATFTVQASGAFSPGSAVAWALSASRAWTIMAVVETNVDASGEWFAFASNGAVQATLAGNMPTLNTATALGSANVDVYEQLVLKANNSSVTITGAPTGYAIDATQYTTATLFGQDLANAANTSNPSPSGTYGGEASTGWTATGTWNILKRYVFAFKQSAPAADIEFRAMASASAANATISITVPATCQTGDVFLLQFSQNNTDVITSADPAGLTLIDSDSESASWPGRLYRGVVDGTNISAGTVLSWTLSATRQWDAVLYAASGVDNTTPILGWQKLYAVASTDAVIPSITTAADSWLVEIPTSKANGALITAWTPPAGWTGRVTAASANTFCGSAMIADRDAGMATAGTYGGESYTPNAAHNINLSYIVALNPASTGSAVPKALSDSAALDDTAVDLAMADTAAADITLSESLAMTAAGTVADTGLFGESMSIDIQAVTGTGLPLIVGAITGPGIRQRTVDGLAVRRAVDGAAVSRAVDGPAQEPIGVNGTGV